MKMRLLVNLLEQKIHYVSAPDPQMQLGTPPSGGRKMAAMYLNHLNQLRLQAEILGNQQEVGKN